MAKKKARGGKSREVLVVASKMKNYVRGKKMNASGDLADATSKCVYEVLDAAIKRAQANGRKTVRATDV